MTVIVHAPRLFWQLIFGSMSNNMQMMTGAKPANQSALIEEVLGSLAAEVSKAAGLARVAGKAAGMVGASARTNPGAIK